MMLNLKLFNFSSTLYIIFFEMVTINEVKELVLQSNDSES